MPFREYSPFFGPEDLKTLTAAFDATWQELSAANPDLSAEDKAVLMKKKLRSASSSQPRRVACETWRH
jgi:hypothetical protein